MSFFSPPAKRLNSEIPRGSMPSINFLDQIEKQLCLQKNLCAPKCTVRYEVLVPIATEYTTLYNMILDTCKICQLCMGLPPLRIRLPGNLRCFCTPWALVTSKMNWLLKYFSQHIFVKWDPSMRNTKTICVSQGCRTSGQPLLPVH